MEINPETEKPYKDCSLQKGLYSENVCWQMETLLEKEKKKGDRENEETFHKRGV